MYQRGLSHDLISEITGLSQDQVIQYRLLAAIFGKYPAVPELYNDQDTAETQRGVKQAQKELAQALLRHHQPAEVVSELTLLSKSELDLL